MQPATIEAINSQVDRLTALTYLTPTQAEIVGSAIHSVLGEAVSFSSISEAIDEVITAVLDFARTFDSSAKGGLSKERIRRIGLLVAQEKGSRK
jgi:hypothetical protein